MNANDKRKQEQVQAMSTEALRRIVDHPLSQEAKEPSAEYPLGGLVHLSGIGQVKLTALRAELDSRQKK